MRISSATSADRAEIHRIRHSVYATELGQHDENAEGVLSDILDDHNEFIVAAVSGEIVGFVSITGPGGGIYSIDKYFDRATLPIAFDEGLYEVRILMVKSEYRGGPLALALAYAALRLIEEQGGRHVAAIGRIDLVPFYRKLGFVPLELRVRSGEVEFELMHATVPVLRRRAGTMVEPLASMRAVIIWDLPFAFDPEERCEHGGASVASLGERFENLDGRDGIVAADALDAWFPPSPKVTEAIAPRLGSLMRTSPPVTATGLIATIAETRGIDPDAIAAGSGSSDIIYRMIPQWVTPSTRALVIDPTYGEYVYLLEHVVGCAVDRFVLRRANDFVPDIDALVTQVASGVYGLVVIVNPNNPTGQLIARSQLARLFAAAPGSTRFLIDEAYIEYAGIEHSVEPIAATTPNVTVVKSMAKVYALSGMRVAYLCAAPAIAREARKQTPPWSIGLPAQIAATIALCDQEYYRQRHRETAVLRDELAARLRAATGQLVVHVGRINAVLCELPDDGPTAAELVRRCAGDGVYLRDVATMGRSIGDRHVRIAVQSASDNERIVTSVAAALAR